MSCHRQRSFFNFRINLLISIFSLQVGDRVVALPEYRAWAELVVVPAKYVFSIPSNMSYQDAAAIAMNFLVAHILLFDLGNLRPGKSVLFHSAGGGVVSILVTEYVTCSKKC